MKRSWLSLCKERVLVGALVLGGVSAAASPVAAEISQEEFNKMLKTALTTDEGQNMVGEATENYLKDKQLEARKKQAEVQQAEMENQFKNPVTMPVGKSPVKGPADAKITVVEFSDFECPYCSRGKDTMEQLLKAYPQDVKLVFKNLPLEFHQNAKPAAKAALAAGNQGKFWEMHDALFANQRNLNDQFYTEQAKKLGLDVEKFKTDMKSPEIEAQIEEDIKLARQHEISGTPAFFVNGVAVRGAYPLDHFKTIVDRWLQKK